MLQLKEKECLRTELSNDNKKILIFECATTSCKNELRVPPNKIKQYTGYCTSCLRKKNPYGVTYNRLLSNCKIKNIKNTLTYEEFLCFTKIENCTYCNSKIKWIEFTTSKSGSVAYNLDRKDSSKEYSKENCVVCCKICNWAKNDIFTHEEFLEIGKTIRKVLSKRATL